MQAAGYLPGKSLRTAAVAKPEIDILKPWALNRKPQALLKQPQNQNLWGGPRKVAPLQLARRKGGWRVTAAWSRETVGVQGFGALQGRME